MESFVNFIIGLTAFGFIGGAGAASFALVSYLLKNGAECLAALSHQEGEAKAVESDKDVAIELEAAENQAAFEIAAYEETQEEDGDCVDWAVYDTPTFRRKAQHALSGAALTGETSEIEPVDAEFIEWGIDPNTGLPFTAAHFA